MKRRVVVTGIGVVSCVGLGVEAFCESLRNGVNGKARVTAFDPAGFEQNYVCEVKNFDPASHVRSQSPDRLGRSAQFAIAGARMALADAGIDADAVRGAPIPSLFGTTDGESAPFEELTRQYHLSGMTEFEPDLLRLVPAQEIALAVAREFDLVGEALVLSTACAAGSYAVGIGYDMVSAGETEIAICGGSDSICRKTFAGFYRLGTMSPDNCRPFDIDRHGILTGEGSAVLILETLEGARRRGARIYAEVLGYAINCDADHMVAPNRDSIAACMRLAHDRAGIAAADVDFVCMHGTGTRANDITESQAVRMVFGDRNPPVSSIKSSLGHGMGAASTFGAAACCLAIDRGFLPPTINLERQDPDCEVDVVANTARTAWPRVVQNDAFAFGGNNAITLFGRVDAQPACA